MTLRFLKKLGAPYPCDFSASSALRVGLVSGIFVSLFFALLHPFGLAMLSGSVRLSLYLGYGFLCFLLIVLNALLGPRVFRLWFREDAWTIGKHILHATWIILTIGLASFFFTQRLFLSAGLSLEYLHLTGVLAGALIIGAIPVTVMTLVDQNILLRRSHLAVDEANARIEAPHAPSGQNRADDREVRLIAQNGKDGVHVAASALLYISAEENYVTVHYKKERPAKILLRSSLTRIEEQLRGLQPAFFRCHRAYIINPAKILKVTGNAQGLKLTLEDVEIPIPVARRFVGEFRRTVVPRL